MNNERFDLEDAIDVIDEILRAGGEFRFYPRGTSMRPLLVEGRDSVALRRDPSISPKRGDIVFYRRENGSFVLHRVMRREADGTYSICGDHQTEWERGIKDSQVIGYVSAVYRGEKRMEVSSLRYRAYVFFWSLMPLRRFLLAVRRRSGKQKKNG